MMGFGILGMFLFWCILLLFVIGGVGWARQTGSLQAPTRQNERTARQVLDRRLASGEISLDEYDELRGQIE